ncbi:MULTISPECIES: hypothetical protein [unclassified Mycolicibacterium]|uniref:hypothetical protein n=1 Tax=unclassified Mycolicibacterium TaxID=2636767 RepID=UPI0012DE8BC6|nr:MULTISPECIES: hypothetical protein [unclassified Mycolicibacterium]MUL81671.1 hypothetical protein [Mycolicibacterium sp. CBMA 329]MUL87437.1 hypothetical protein [Mycolicibacterium sp. CBMA 331]MUL99697.1 hypothetical protein [Mycolicibacterium sp. CBMA 334]MUM28282.1 hypothetical protein [Mycolicibacterium sp. CBMA 295]MUM37734.1 hypothetical protein [Mycolicibacterium sp. CBMA 247]
MRATRLLLALIGVGLGCYGVLLIWENPLVIIMRIVVWAVVAVVVHDFVFAPLCAAAGWTGRRLIPADFRSPVAVASLCSVVLLLLAIPVYGRPGMRPDNMTVLDRNYPLGLAVSLAVVWLSVLLYQLIRRLLPVRQDEVVERQRTDDVDGQPEAH